MYQNFRQELKQVVLALRCKKREFIDASKVENLAWVWQAILEKKYPEAQFVSEIQKR